MAITEEMQRDLRVQFGARGAAAVQAGHGGKSDDAGAEKHLGLGLEVKPSTASAVPAEAGGRAQKKV